MAVGDALDEADRDRDVRVVVVTGAGDKAFCAGADLKAMARGEQIIPEGKYAQWGFAGWVAHPISKPTIAAVNGVAIGGGFEMVLACDLVVAAEHAQFSLPEVQRGLLAGAGGAFRIVQQIPPRIGMEILLTGEPLSAGRAIELNLINRVVPTNRVLDTALELADKIASNAPLSVQASKRIAMGIVDGEQSADRTGWQHTATAVDLILGSQDALEGPRAFAEKRKPVWTGS
jgi:crotonobetainyl-CoA hydratase